MCALPLSCTRHPDVAGILSEPARRGIGARRTRRRPAAPQPRGARRRARRRALRTSPLRCSARGPTGLSRRAWTPSRVGSATRRSTGGCKARRLAGCAADEAAGGAAPRASAGRARAGGPASSRRAGRSAPGRRGHDGPASLSCSEAAPREGRERPLLQTASSSRGACLVGRPDAFRPPDAFDPPDASRPSVAFDPSDASRPSVAFRLPPAVLLPAWSFRSPVPDCRSFIFVTPRARARTCPHRGGGVAEEARGGRGWVQCRMREEAPAPARPATRQSTGGPASGVGRLGAPRRARLERCPRGRFSTAGSRFRLLLRALVSDLDPPRGSCRQGVGLFSFRAGAWRETRRARR